MVGDVSYREDHSRARTGHAARLMASARNLAISLASIAGCKNIPKPTITTAPTPPTPYTGSVSASENAQALGHGPDASDVTTCPWWQLRPHHP